MEAQTLPDFLLNRLWELSKSWLKYLTFPPCMNSKGGEGTMHTTLPLLHFSFLSYWVCMRQVFCFTYCVQFTCLCTCVHAWRPEDAVECAALCFSPSFVFGIHLSVKLELSRQPASRLSNPPVSAIPSIHTALYVGAEFQDSVT